MSGAPPTGDLQRLSSEYAIRIRVVPDDESPFVGFKLHYPVLFECLAIFALHLIADLLSKFMVTYAKIFVLEQA